ncbi:MAG TPA: BrnA antitoxin family protein [Rhodopila sp.]|nr:BrnA antitoxin family protein [Rhodopila sp.]
MPRKNSVGSTDWSDPDDAPELTADMLDNAEVFDGDRFVRRGRGRPKADTVKEQISVRLDPDVIAKLREAGPGWQSRLNDLLRAALGLPEAGKHAA